MWIKTQILIPTFIGILFLPYLMDHQLGDDFQIN